jgi:hypothetical protein
LVRRRERGDGSPPLEVAIHPDKRRMAGPQVDIGGLAGRRGADQLVECHVELVPGRERAARPDGSASFLPEHNPVIPVIGRGGR